jgi:isopentenyl phosphate kinase
MTTVLKLGGSVITEKETPETVDEAALSAASRAVGISDEPLVIVHGGGSFGHHHAATRGVDTTEGTQDAADVRAIHRAMGALNERVVDALAEAGVAAVPMRPLSVGHKTADAAFVLPTDAVEAALGEGFVPVLHGDVVAHAESGASVVSGDTLVVELAEGLSVDRVGLCSTVPGVLDEDGTVIDRIERFDTVAAALGDSDATDVTGGMAGKVRTLLDLPVPASVFGPEALEAFLAGDPAGTRILGGE